MLHEKSKDCISMNRRDKLNVLSYYWFNDSKTTITTIILWIKVIIISAKNSTYWMIPTSIAYQICCIHIIVFITRKLRMRIRSPGQSYLVVEGRQNLAQLCQVRQKMYIFIMLLFNYTKPSNAVPNAGFVTGPTSNAYVDTSFTTATTRMYVISFHCFIILNPIPLQLE